MYGLFVIEIGDDLSYVAMMMLLQGCRGQLWLEVLVVAAFGLQYFQLT